MRSASLKQQIQDELTGARDYLRSCVESLSDAQKRVALLESMSASLTDDREQFVRDLVSAGILEPPRPF